MGDDNHTGTPHVEDYPAHVTEKVRYADTDRQGHVNNAVFATFLESGRVAVLYDPQAPLAQPGTSFVIARLELDFRAEMTWPGDIVVGTRVASLGRSSIVLEQGIFQGDTCVATAKTVIVAFDESTRRSRPLPESAVAILRDLSVTKA
ncbi:acyl-CoA thioesterase [Gordonia sp. HNM0687]|uniref:Acyl-CoA thioesterase n=1 Tax=Gordonia mangrovi TaxID=2665643 RepID=A0A6L7GR58_9ACTN|nr:thioesterase family protein [Gordonia mangrovi]MXP22376.1 acyl-CoA thioesterase [Gordonia mangrovi]UVF77736.1 acyl-CoA thioesterase [Gordonia mangrovi]